MISAAVFRAVEPGRKVKHSVVTALQRHELSPNMPSLDVKIKNVGSLGGHGDSNTVSRGVEIRTWGDNFQFKMKRRVLVYELEGKNWDDGMRFRYPDIKYS